MWFNCYCILFIISLFLYQIKAGYSKIDKLYDLLNNIDLDEGNDILINKLGLEESLLKYENYSMDFIPHPPTSDQLITQHGYPCEIHDIITDDGYILRAFRIPYGQTSNNNTGRPPLILQHGLLCSSDCWILSDPSKGLGFRLADEGYDVWITNSRGSTYSMNHTTLTIQDPKYWNFSLQELATKDLPATIDYILNITGYEKLTYVGHSQGTTIFFILTSTLPEYNEKILVMSALAPIAFLDQMSGLPQKLISISKILTFMANNLHIYHILHHSTFILIMDHVFCNPKSIFLPVCDTILSFIFSFDSPQFNKTLVEAIGDCCPAGASVKQMEHFSQFAKGRFAQFDYGPEGNIIEYHTLVPPEYNFNKITVPVVLHYSKNDHFSTPREVMKLYSKFPNLVGLFCVPYKLFNHIDFMWAIDVNKLLYNQVIYIIKQFL